MAGTWAPTVLLVEDQPAILELLAEALLGAGYRVAAAADGSAALAAALADPPALDGAALCRRLMAHPRTRAVPVLVVTALPPAAAAARLTCCPPTGLAHKDAGLDGILRAAAALLPAPA